MTKEDLISTVLSGKNPCPYVNFVNEEQVLYKSLLKKFIGLISEIEGTDYVHFAVIPQFTKDEIGELEKLSLDLLKESEE